MKTFGFELEPAEKLSTIIEKGMEVKCASATLEMMKKHLRN